MFSDRKFAAYEILSLLFVRDGIPQTCICNNAKEMIQVDFYQKLKGTVCHLKQLEPYTLWSNAAQCDVKELKKGSHHKLFWARVPNTYRTIDQSWKPILGPLVPMRLYIRWGVTQSSDIR